MSQPNTRQTLERRALGAMIESAIFDWKSGVVVALTVLLTFFAGNIGGGSGWFGWPWWYWAAGGGVAWAALVVSMLTDPTFGARVVADMLRHDFDPAKLRNKDLQGRINKALDYRQRIAEAFGRARQNLLPDDLKGLEGQIDNWIANLYTLSARLDAYEQEDVILQDLRSVPLAIQNLQAKLKSEGDPAVREQIQQTLQAKQQQLDSLKQLQGMMQKAELQMDSTITALGTVYSQLLLVGVKDIDSGRAQRLREDISEQVNQLQDLSSSLDEVYRHRT
jgi:hypothetical protein